MSRPGPSPLSGPSPRTMPSPRGTGPSPLAGPSPRAISGPSPRAGPGPSPIARARGLPASTPTRQPSISLPSGSPSVPSKRSASMSHKDKDKDKDSKKIKLAPGNAWIAGQVSAMQTQYKDALVAATMIMQFQADAKAIGYKSRPPARLQARLTAAWRNYDAIRRHVEWFISQNIEYAAAPDKFAARRPPPLAQTLLPTPSPASALPAHLQNTPAAASPVPLSSGFLTQRPEPSIPGMPEGLFGMNLDGMSMDELQALIGTGGDFTAPPANDFMAPQTEMGPPQLPQDVDAMTPTSKLFATLGNSPKATFSSPKIPTASPAPAQPTPKATTGATPTNPAQAPMPDAAAADDFDFANMDLSGIDLSSFEGMFTTDGAVGDATAGSGDALAVLPQPAQGADAAFNFEAFLSSGDAADTAQAQPQPQAQASPQKQATTSATEPAPVPAPPPAAQPEPAPAPPLPVEPPASQPAPAQAASAPAIAPAPATAPMPVPEPVPQAVPEPPAPAQPEPVPEPPANEPFEAGEFGDIDFDAFNFDDMPGVDGDEFASLLAEFK